MCKKTFGDKIRLNRIQCGRDEMGIRVCLRSRCLNDVWVQVSPSAPKFIGEAAKLEGCGGL